MSDPAGFAWDDVEERPVYRLYTARETAENIGVSERTIRRWIVSGRLAAEKDGGEFRIDQDAARAAMVGTRTHRHSAHDESYIAWLERENERLWALVEKAVSS